MRSVLSVPLLVDGEAIGEMNLASTRRAGFTAEHRDIAVEVAAPLAIAIQQARLRDELGRQTSELERRVAERGAALRAVTAELETMMYAVSHDLREPLRHICGFTQLLLDDAGPALDPAVQHYARRIRDGAGRLAGLVDDLVSLTGEPPGHDAAPGRSHLAGGGRGEPASRRRPRGRAGGRVAGRARCRRWTAIPRSWRSRCRACCRTPLKFTRPRDRTVITIRPIEHEGQAGIAVQDNGVGFKMAYAGKLFGVFQRLHRPDEFEGNGAGLALVQRVAQKHGGRVWAESELDQGATFYVTFGGTPERRNGTPAASTPAHG